MKSKKIIVKLTTQNHPSTINDEILKLSDKKDCVSGENAGFAFSDNDFSDNIDDFNKLHEKSAGKTVFFILLGFFSIIF